MFNLAISLLLSIATTLLLVNLTDWPLWVASLVSLAVFTVCYLLLTRLIMKKVGELMEIAQRDMQAGRIDKAVKVLEDGFRYANWQFYVKAQLNSQIGTLYYLKRDFTKAFDYLQKGFVRHWLAMCMLAICYMKRNQTTKMVTTFEKALAGAKKEALAWNVYAYCLDQVGDREKAMEVLTKGITKTGGDERLESSLAALKEGKRMKMRAYGDMWFQFHLEKPGALIKEQTKAVMGRRKIMRR